jgi:tetratricopeptide (TPR) repeat protein
MMNQAIIVLKDPNLRSMFRSQLKADGVEEIHSPAEIEPAKTVMRDLPQAIVIMDWERDPVERAQLLTAAVQGTFSRPIYMLAPSISRELVLTAAEYGVMRVQTGNLAPATIQSYLKSIFEEIARNSAHVQVLQEVTLLRCQNRLADAHQLLLNQHKDYPNDARIANELADTLIAMEKWREAFDILDDLLAIDPDNLRSQHLFARCLMQRGEFEEAILILENARLISPNHVERLVTLGQAYLYQDRVAAAREAFEAARLVDEDSREATEGMAQAALMEGEVNEGLKFLRLLSNTREAAAVFNNAGILSIRHQRFERGIALYQAAIKALGGQSHIAARLVMNLGLGYHKWGKLDRALACFQAAAKLDKTYEKAQHNVRIMSGGAKPNRNPQAHAGVDEPDLVGDTFENLFGTKQLNPNDDAQITL